MNHSQSQPSFAALATAGHPLGLQAVSLPQPDAGKRNNDSEAGGGLPGMSLVNEQEFAAVLIGLENPRALKEIPPAPAMQKITAQKNSQFDTSEHDPVLPNPNIPNPNIPNAKIYGNTTTISGQAGGGEAETKPASKSTAILSKNTLLEQNTLFVGTNNTNSTPPTTAPSPSGNTQAPENAVLDTISLAPVPTPMPILVPDNADRRFFGPPLANITNTPRVDFSPSQLHPPTTPISYPKPDIDTRLEGGKPDRNQAVINTANFIQFPAQDSITPDTKIAQQLTSSNPDTALLQTATTAITEKPTSSQTIGFQAVATKQNQLIITQIGEVLVGQIANKTSAIGDNTGNALKPILVQLSPAELGRVQIQFSFDANERIKANIIAESVETGLLLKQKSELLFSHLKLGGFNNIDLSFEAKNENNFSSFGSGASKNQNAKIEQHATENYPEDEAQNEHQKTALKPHTAHTNMHKTTDRLDITL